MNSQMPVPPARQRKASRKNFLPGSSADCRRKGSSCSSAVFLGPAGGQRGGNERQEQLVVAGDSVAVRFRAAAAAGGRGGALHYILQRTVVLDKVEVRGGNGAERDLEIANDGNGFQKNFGQKDGGAPIEIDAAGMHLLYKSAEQSEVVMRGIAKCSAVGGGMHVRNVRADGEMDGHGNAVFVGGHENAGIRMFYFDDAAREKLPGGFTVFGGVAGDGDFEIVDERCAVHGNSGDEAAFH